MHNYRLIYLDFGTSAIHHSTSRFAGSQEHSGGLPENDTIISAAAVAWLQVTGEFPKWFEQPEVYNVACSSLLPVINDKLYLPVPQKMFRVLDNQRHKNKDAKKIVWLKEDIWRDWAANPEFCIKLKVNNEGKVDSDSILDISSWIKESVVDRVALHPKHTLDLVSNEEQHSVPYRVKLFHFMYPHKDKNGIYKSDKSKAALILPENVTEEFVNALIVLGKLGIGGDKSYGYGQFSVEEKTKLEFDDSNVNSRVNLGLLYPNEEIKENLSLSPIWSIVTRQGRSIAPGTSIPIVTKSINMINRGAVLDPSCGAVAGETANVFPEEYEGAASPRIIFRSGRTVCLPTRHNLSDARCTVEYI